MEKAVHAKVFTGHDKAFKQSRKERFTQNYGKGIKRNGNVLETT